jgi:FkbM family methyltransferase
MKKITPSVLLEAVWAARHYNAWYGWRVMKDHLLQPFYRRRYQWLNRNLSKDTQALCPGITLRVVPEIRRCFELYAYMDMRNVLEMRGFVRYARHAECLLDIGALYGDFSLVFSALTGGRAYAVDPSPMAREVMEQVLHMNPQADITPFNIALGAETCAIDMCFEWIHCVANETGTHAGNTIQVQQYALDAFLQQVPQVPDVIKIDAEGSELDILEGGHRFFSEYGPRIFLEVHPTYLEKRGQHVDALIRKLHALDYTLYHSDGHPVRDPGKVLSQSEGYLVHRIICNRGPLPRY